MKYTNHHTHTQGGNNTVYVVPPNTVATIRAMTIHNPIAKNTKVAVYVGGVGDEHRIINRTIAENMGYLCPELANHVFGEGTTIIITGTGVNVWLSVSEI